MPGAQLVNKYMTFFAVLVAVTLLGCATERDLRIVSSSLDSKIRSLQDEFATLQEEQAQLTKSMGQVDKLNRALQQKQADSGADFIDLRNEIQKLRGDIELLHNEVRKSKTETKGGDTADVRQKLDEISLRINYIENYLGVGKKADAEVSPRTKAVTSGAAVAKPVDKEKSYAGAYTTFKEGRYAEARKQFQAFVKAFPDTEYSDNAQFWIGECYYFEKQYEKAILEYENVINKYPKGNKVPNALLKQALSFMELQDKSSAKLLLQRVIKEYPNTSPARIARKKLSGIR